MDGCVLRMYGINKSFFGVPVLKNAQLEVPPGEVHILLGENGVGRSILIKILPGVYGQEGGNIWLDGRELVSMTPKEASDAGISVIYQGLDFVPDLLIYENIFIGKGYGQGVLVDHKRAIKEVEGYMRRVDLKVNPRTLIRELSVVRKQLVGIAETISNHVKILTLDESIAAVTDKEASMLFGIIWELQKEKTGIIYISHRMSELLETRDRHTVTHDGEYIGTIRLSESPEDELTKMTVGRTVSFKEIANETIDMNQVVLKAENLRYKGFLKDISFELHKDEILGSAGLVGAGRAEVVKCMIGAYRKNGGTVAYKGRTLSNNLSRNIGKGVVYPSEDRKDKGLALMHSVMDNIALPDLKRLAKPFIHKKEMADHARDYVRGLRIKTHTHLTEAKNLSEGNQQKVAIAKWLYSNANIYIFDKPTKGINIGVRDEIYSIMYDLVNQEASTITIPSDPVGVLEMYDRVAVMREDILEATLDSDPDLTQGIILKYAMQGGI